MPKLKKNKKDKDKKKKNKSKIKAGSSSNQKGNGITFWVYKDKKGWKDSYQYRIESGVLTFNRPNHSTHNITLSDAARDYESDRALIIKSGKHHLKVEGTSVDALRSWEVDNGLRSDSDTATAEASSSTSSSKKVAAPKRTVSLEDMPEWIAEFKAERDENQGKIERGVLVPVLNPQANEEAANRAEDFFPPVPEPEDGSRPKIDATGVIDAVDAMIWALDDLFAESEECGYFDAYLLYVFRYVRTIRSRLSSIGVPESIAQCTTSDLNKLISVRNCVLWDWKLFSLSLWFD